MSGGSDVESVAVKGVSPWAIAVVVSMATFMEALDTTIANVALRYIAGGLGVSFDEASWVVTTYLVANAIVLVASSYLSQLFGRKRFFLGCLVLFTAASILCGFSNNLNELLFFRIVQGFAGGGMVPVSQAILAASFPPEQRGQAFALFGVAVVVGPVVGPTLGGWLADNISWHWCFLINGPVGVVVALLVYLLIQEPAAEAEERRKWREKGLPFDWTGFLLIATFLGALEVVLDRGQTEDWFGSNFIVTFAVISGVAFVLMFPWTLTRENPVIDLHILFTRQYGACFLVMGATGAILYGTTQFLPELLQDYYNYTATWSGLALSPGGLVTMLGMFLVGRIGNFVQPKHLIAFGAAVIALAMWNLTNLYADLNFAFFAWSRIYVGIGLPLIFIPILTASFVGIPPNKIDQASALINAARNTGGSIGVSICANTLAHREQFHQSRLVEGTIPSDVAYQETLRIAEQHFSGGGTITVGAQDQALAWLQQQVETQAGLLAYIDVWWTLMIISAAAVPLAMSLSRVELGKGPPAGG